MLRITWQCTALLFLIGFAGAACAAGRLELVMFDSATCDWCDRWRADIGPIYAKSEEGRTAPLRVVSIHATKPADLTPITGIVYTPTFVLWDGEREIGRILGYGGEIQFWGLLAVLLKKHKEQSATPATTLSTSNNPLRATPVENSR